MTIATKVGVTRGADGHAHSLLTPERIAAMTPIVSLQMGYSLVRREFEHLPCATCAKLGIGMLAYEPLCRGLLTGKYTYEPAFPETDLRHRDDRFKGRRFLHGQRLAADLAKVVPVSPP